MLHKLKLAPFFFMAGVVASFGVQAASSVDLKVTGRILPSACAIALSGDGKADFGTLAGLQTGGAAYGIGVRELALSIDCQSAMPVAIKLVDNKYDTIDAASTTKKDKLYLFGLGTSGGKKIGSYELTFKDFADGKNKLTMGFSNGGLPWVGSHEGWAQNNGTLVAFSEDGSNVASIKNLKGTLQVYANLGPSLDLKNEVDLDGSTTLELNYF